jgi:hypothetical protein
MGNMLLEAQVGRAQGGPGIHLFPAGQVTRAKNSEVSGELEFMF